ncbi:hypothetical protein [Metaclostridioides mangenotii]|uniref:hypothetical protein n=1 Tax=Metaclostridioides mangenotii TaxID=1540 RepID=UPI002F402C3E
MKKLLSKARQAIKDFDLIQEDDKIAVGLALSYACGLISLLLFSLSIALFKIPSAINLATSP